MAEREPHPRTIATLDRLDKAEWFSRLGEIDFETSIFVKNWEEAHSYASSIAWENLKIEAANRIRIQLLSRNKRRFNEWNMVASTIRPFAIALVKDKFESIDLNAAFSEKIASNTRWDIIHLCMECEYLDIIEPGFFHSLAFYYVEGHFPCGFKGEFPNGKQIVF
ncbi:hypothetical protein [Methylobacterium sp. Leaf87]|jgi:hypothetical protein|uniref:hypothetical protein n=1 Tax=Methylobacterium sp. Leaf87 TaxID=1736243 RepID=UPI000A5FC6ED|nr:hypothetical protein [Methylobacterium sp. Leaf87]